MYSFLRHLFAPRTLCDIALVKKLTTMSSEGKSTTKQLAEESSEGGCKQRGRMNGSSI